MVHRFEGKSINDALTYSPDGSLLVGPMDLHTLSVWDAETGKVVRTIDTKEPTIRDAAFRPDGARLAVAGDSGLSDDLVCPRLGARAVVAGQRATRNALPI